MRRTDKCVTDLKMLHDIIQTAQVCRMGLVDGATPYIVPLNFGFDGTSIYVHSAQEGHKVEILRRNNRVCLEFERGGELVKGKKACDYGYRYLSVVCQGTAEIVAGEEKKRDALNQIMQHYEPGWQPYAFTAQELASVLVYKITIHEMTGKAS
jgi:uncharacterized protein